MSQTGTVLATNQAARRILESADLLSARHGIVSLNTTPLGKKLRDLIRVAREGGSAGIRLLRPGGKPILAVGTPLNRNESQSPGTSTAAAVIYIADEQPLHAINPVLLAGLFGFTPAEAKVAVQMMQGHTVEDIAAKLRISQHTTRNHLKRLYAKTGTRKQCEFVHAMLTSPARLAVAMPAEEPAASTVAETWRALPQTLEPGEALFPPL